MSADPIERVAVATSNSGKLREFRTLLAEVPVQLCSLAALPAVTFPAEGDDYAANAVAKAAAVAGQLGLFALADDSGLEVDALGGAPGPHSARYGGEGLDDAGRVAHLLQALEGVSQTQRGARFVCVAALATPDGRCLQARGECEGRILRVPCGAAGFGYDPVFQPSGESRSMAELEPRAKHALSHRGRALRALARIVRGGP